MSRLSSFLIAAVLAAGLTGATLAQPQTDPAPGATQSDTGAKDTGAKKAKKKMSKEERQKLKEEKRAAKKAAMSKLTPQERKALRAKRQDCRAQGKQEGLKGKKFRGFVQNCLKG